MPPGVDCPGGCEESKEIEGACYCPDISVFDASQQFQVVVVQSNANKVKNVGALADYNPVTSAPFWLAIGISVWTVATLVIVLKVAAKSCLIASTIQGKTASETKKLYVAFMVSILLRLFRF